jgi:hypothetical protein
MAEALMRGLGAIFRPRLLLIYWLLSVVLAAGVMLGFQWIAKDATGALPDQGTLAAEAPSPYWDDFREANGKALGVLGSGASFVTWLWILATTVLAGGLVRAFEKRAAENRKREGRIWTLRTFLGDSGQFAFRMMRLLVVALVLAHAADWFFNGVLKTWHDEHLVAIESERVSVMTDWLRQGLFALVIFLIATWSDVARVQVVIEQRSSVLGGLVSAGDALISRPIELLGLGAFFLTTEWLAMVFFAVGMDRIRVDSGQQIVWWVLASQLLILLRIGLGFARVAAYTSVAEDLRAESEARIGPIV